jgi:peptidoglycan LD-endopeptidase LytH
MHPLTSLIFRCATSVALLATATACAPGLRPLPLPERAAPPAAEPAGKTAEQPAATWLTDADYLKSRQLMVPVHGVDPANVTDSFNDPRDGGARTHQAVDILAPRGTPVIAATDGVVLRMRSNTLGGITIYAVDSDRRFVYYYAHLERYEDGLAEGQSVVQGQVHFQVMKMRADGRWWDGEPVDPRPFLFQAGIASGTDVEAARRASR